jgi:hypothetical protein
MGTWARPREGWRDTDVWLDPSEMRWFGERAQKTPAGPLVPLVAGVDWGAVALPAPGLRIQPQLDLARVRGGRRAHAPSRARRLATRLFPTVTGIVAVGAAVPMLLASRAADPVVAPAAQPAPVQVVRIPTPFPQAQEVEPSAPPAAELAVEAVAPEAKPAAPAITWRESQAIGVPHIGRLVDGVRLPREGPGWVTWDPVLDRVPNRANRLFGTDTLVRFVLDVIEGYRAAHPKAPALLIGDLSFRGGGEIDEHVSHENGRDVDVYYPRLDGRLRPPASVDQIDVRLAQDLVDRFVAAGAQIIFVGSSVPVDGPSGVVVSYPNHNNHMHVRIPHPASGRG